MIFEGDHGVIEALHEKKRLRATGRDHEHIKPLLIIDGGLMKGAYGVGAAIALEDAGLIDSFVNVVGISSGAPTAAYLLGKNTHEGSRVLIEDCTSKEFLNVWRFWQQVNTRYVIDILSTDPPRGIDDDAVFKSAITLHIGVADFLTGKPKLIVPQTEIELFQAIHASILMPNISTEVVTLKDIRYVDGGFTRPHIMDSALKEIAATHVLVITNQDQSVTTIPRLERLLNHTIYRWRMPGPLRFAAHERRRERMKVIAAMKQNSDVPYGLVWGDHSIGSMERNPRTVATVVERSRAWWQELLHLT
ncbi:hypothetical protein N9L26_00785 [Candidatus Pacebacteria bacterium]|nr:hypothetical protein [Candidatus Paceibacterota bacterium]